MLIDLDRFKAVNDTYGHAAGDAVLVEVAKRMQNNLRTVDLVARIGGEEFLVAMPGADLEQGKEAAHRLRRVICDTPILLPNALPDITVSVSIGLALGSKFSSPSLTVEAIMGLADSALYSAKSEGRNQVTISQSAA